METSLSRKQIADAIFIYMSINRIIADDIHILTEYGNIKSAKISGTLNTENVGIDELIKFAKESFAHG